MMDDLIAWLRACIDLDEWVARAATDGPWTHDPGKEWHTDPDKLRAARAGWPQPGGMEFVGAGAGLEHGVATTGLSGDRQSMYDARHIALHDPAHVLARCAANRLIVELAATWIVSADQAGERQDPPALIVRTQGVTARTVLRVLALAYADRRGYREEWRP